MIAFAVACVALFAGPALFGAAGAWLIFKADRWIGRIKRTKH